MLLLLIVVVVVCGSATRRDVARQWLTSTKAAVWLVWQHVATTGRGGRANDTAPLEPLQNRTRHNYLMFD